MTDLLTKLAKKYNCDKCDKNHGYTPLYNNIFSHYKDKNFNLLEFGFGLGGSVQMWLEYFSAAKLISIDISHKIPVPIKNKRFKYIGKNQIDKSGIIPVLNQYENFLAIIDDASHVAEDQQFTMGFAFEYVVPGGWYIIEDLKCKRNHSKFFLVEADKTLTVLEDYIKTGRFDSKMLTLKENKYITDNIESVQIFDKIAFIKKKGL